MGPPARRPSSFFIRHSTFFIHAPALPAREKGREEECRMSNEECRMKNGATGTPTFFILHSSFDILHSRSRSSLFPLPSNLEEVRGARFEVRGSREKKPRGGMSNVECRMSNEEWATGTPAFFILHSSFDILHSRSRSSLFPRTSGFTA